MVDRCENGIHTSNVLIYEREIPILITSFINKHERLKALDDANRFT